MFHPLLLLALLVAPQAAYAGDVQAFMRGKTMVVIGSDERDDVHLNLQASGAWTVANTEGTVNGGASFQSLPNPGVDVDLGDGPDELTVFGALDVQVSGPMRIDTGGPLTEPVLLSSLTIDGDLWFDGDETNMLVTVGRVRISRSLRVSGNALILTGADATEIGRDVKIAARSVALDLADGSSIGGSLLAKRGLRDAILRGTTIGKNVSVKTTRFAPRLELVDSHVEGKVSIKLREPNRPEVGNQLEPEVRIAGTVVEGSTRIQVKNTRERVTNAVVELSDAEIQGNFRVKQKHGALHFRAADGSVFRGKADVRVGGDGENVVEVTESTFEKRSRARLGTGADTVSVQGEAPQATPSVFMDDVRMSLGAGDDVVTLGSSNTIEDRVQLQGRVRLDGRDGTDVLDQANIVLSVPIDAKNFEPQLCAIAGLADAVGRPVPDGLAQWIDESPGRPQRESNPERRTLSPRRRRTLAPENLSPACRQVSERLLVGAPAGPLARAPLQVEASVFWGRSVGERRDTPA